MAIFQLNNGVRIAGNDPIDYDRYIASDLTQRDALITNSRVYDGVQVYVVNEQKLYIRKGSSWELVGSDPSALAGFKDYVDGSLAFRDAEINQLDASIIRIDSSINNLYSTKQNNITDGTFLKESSLGPDFAWVGGQLDVSIVSTDASVQDLYNYVSDLSTNKLNNFTDTFNGVLTVNGSIFIMGDIIQNGSTYITHTENIEVSSNIITMRAGATTQLPDGSLSGFFIVKPDGTNNLFMGTDKDGIMRVGWEGDVFQAVATREDTPIDRGYAYWDDSSTMLKTHDLKGDIDTSLLLYATNSSINSAAFAKNASLSLYVQKAGDTMSGGLIIDASLTVPYIYAKDGSVSGQSLNIKAGNGGITGSGGDIIILAGNRDALASPGPGGRVYLSPGRQTDGGGSYVNSIMIGHPTYNSSAIGIQAEILLWMFKVAVCFMIVIC